MDFKDWQGPLLGILGTVIAGLFGFQTYRRKGSQDKLAEVENSVSANYVDGLIDELKESRLKEKATYDMLREAERRADRLSFQVETNTAELDRLNRLRDHDLADKKRLTQQVDQLTRVVVQMGVPQDQQLRLQETGFGGLR